MKIVRLEIFAEGVKQNEMFFDTKTRAEQCTIAIVTALNDKGQKDITFKGTDITVITKDKKLSDTLKILFGITK